MLKMMCLMMLALLSFAAVQAQEFPRQPMRVEVEATDGVTLVGDLWNAELNIQTPAVLLMHQSDATRDSWDVLTPALMEAGYRVLAVDLRGNGESVGQRDWEQAVIDVQTWMDWMQSQPSIRPDRIAMIGASIGANLALVGCGNDGTCVTAIALSPGMDYFGVMPEESVSDALRQRSVLLVGSQGDGQSIAALRELTASARGDVATRIYSGTRHGTNLFAGRGEDLTALILYWLDTHVPRDIE